MNPLRWVVLVLLLLVSIAPAGAVDFQLKDSEGKPLRLADYRGRWVVVNFWAPWCPPCLDEIPDLVDAYDARRDKDLVVIGVTLDYESKTEVMRLAESLMISYPLVLDQKAIKAQFGLVKGLPASWIYDPQGKLIKKHLGRLSPAQIAALTSKQ